MKRSGRVVALAGLTVLSGLAAARPGLAQRDEPAGKEPTEVAAERVRLDYGGATWAVDPDKGPVQVVVTKWTVEAGGTTIEGIVFLEDGGGWRVAGVFRDDSPNPALLGSGVDAELTLAPSGG